MADKLLESSATSAFCSSVATMLAAGIQTDEAVHMLVENRETSQFKTVCSAVYSKLISGCSLADAMESTGAFPDYAVEMVRVGESSGRCERSLRGLSRYYESEDRTFNKLQSAVGYPAALLCIMSVILAFTVTVILPIFTDAYQNISGSLTAGSFNMVSASIIIGWVALAIVLVSTVFVLIVALSARTTKGRERVMRLFEKIPQTKNAMYQLALSRFTSVLSAFVASGVTEEAAMRSTVAAVSHQELSAKLQAALSSMHDIQNPCSLAQAIVEHEIFEPIYGRMLLIGMHTGSADDTLDHLSDLFFEDATMQIDASVDSIEPQLAAFLTIAVGATLIAVMLPLIGVMSSIG